MATANIHQLLAAEIVPFMESKMSFLNHIDKPLEAEFSKEPNGHQIGSYVDVTVPPVPRVYRVNQYANGGSAADQMTEQKVRLNIDMRAQLPVQFTLDEMMFQLDAKDPRRSAYMKRFVYPALEPFCADIETQLLQRAMELTSNAVGTPGTIPNSMVPYGDAGAILTNELAGDSDRYMLVTPDANNTLTTAERLLFNPSEEISRQYRESYVGRAKRADWFETPFLPSLTNGSTVAGVTVSGAGQTGASLLVGGVANGNTFRRGQKFTIAGVFAVNPLTGQPSTRLRKFTITADTTAAGTTVALPIYPAILPAMPNQTVSAGPAPAASLVFDGAAAASIQGSLMFQRNAFSAAFVDVPVVSNLNGYTMRKKGISVTIQSDGDINDLSHKMRIDARFGLVAHRGTHACVVWN
ncbi:MAG: P22 phage major capsid protein family protein [Burkholderiaceae bacterium]